MFSAQKVIIPSNKIAAENHFADCEGKDEINVGGEIRRPDFHQKELFLL